MTLYGAFRRVDQVALLALAIPMQALYMLFPMLIECDATMFLNYARFFTSGDGLYPVRPPGFPVFLALTAVPFDTLWLTMGLHALIGVLLPLLVYRTMAPFHRWLALAAAVVYIWSTLPFSTAKMLLSDQLFMILLVMSVYASSRLYWTQRAGYVYAAILLAFMAWLTRWEGVFLLSATVVNVLVMHRPMLPRFRHVLAACAICAAVAAGWSVMRARALEDPRLIGSVSNGNGLQLMFRTYFFMPNGLLDWERAVLKTRAESDTSGLITHFYPDPPGHFGVRVVEPSNGPESQRLHRLIMEETAARPEIYRSLKPALDSAYQDPSKPRVDYYWHVFGRFDGDPKGIADNFFDQPNPFILDYMWNRLQDRFGLAEADRLYRNVAIEGVVNHPTALIFLARDVLTFFGIELRGIFVGQGSPITFDLYVRANYYATPFNIGDCAMAHLTPQMWAEYSADHAVTEHLPTVSRLLELADYYGRNLVHQGLGFLALATWWVLPFGVHRRFFLFLPLVALGIMVTTAMGVGGGIYNRYEAPPHPFMLLTTAGALLTFRTWMGKRIPALRLRAGAGDPV